MKTNNEKLQPIAETHNIHPTYPDGEPCRVGDFIWFNEGRWVGRVTKLLPPQAMREEFDGWMGHALFLNCGLGKQDSGLPISYAEEDWADDGLAKLTRTELLAVEILFHLLGRQLGEQIWGNDAWRYEARREWLPQPGGGAGEWVWLLSIARVEDAEECREFHFNRATRRFSPADEPWTPLPPPLPMFPACWPLSAPRAPRSFTHASGERYEEGDYVWKESGCPAVTVRRFERLFLPGDPDDAWLMDEARDWSEDGKPAPALGISHDTLCTIEFTENEWYKKVSATEELALKLLLHLLQEHPMAHLPGWVPHCSFSLQPTKVERSDSDTPWHYRWSQWEVRLTFRDEAFSRIHSWRRFRFNHETHDFTLITDERNEEH